MAIGGALATAIFFVIYYSQKKKDTREREKRVVDLDGFKWEKVIAIDRSKVKGNNVLLNFPLLVHLQEPTLRSTAQNGMVEGDMGYDIVFVDALGEVMDYQIESYNPDSGELWAWVRLQELSPFADTRVSLYYGNENIREDLSTQFTWDENYAGIWHFNGDIEDATLSKNSGVSVGAIQVPGKMGYGKQFKGIKNVSGSIIHIPDHNSLDLQEEGTIEAWIYVNSFQDWAGVVYKGDKTDFSDDAYFIQFLGGSERKRLAFGIANKNGTYSYERSAIDLEAETWYHVAFTWDQQTMRLYVNGYDYGSKPNSTVARNTSGGLNIGSQLNEAVEKNPFDGIIDEVRISNVARSQQWVATSYQNQSKPSSFISVDEPQPRFTLLPTDTLGTTTFSSTLKVGDNPVREKRF